MSESPEAIVKRVFLKPLSVRYAVPDRYSDQSAAAEDYINALLGYAEPVLAETLRRIIATRRYPDWPSVPEIVEIAEAVRAAVASRSGGAGVSRAAFANARGRQYADWIMGQMRFQHVRDAWHGGYFREMREFLAAEAIGQILRGWENPKVEIPREMIDQWRSEANAAVERWQRTNARDARRMSESDRVRTLADALGATIRAHALPSEAAE